MMATTAISLHSTFIAQLGQAHRIAADREKSRATTCREDNKDYTSELRLNKYPKTAVKTAIALPIISASFSDGTPVMAENVSAADNVIRARRSHAWHRLIRHLYPDAGEAFTSSAR
jgi:hypothetical protein